MHPVPFRLRTLPVGLLMLLAALRTLAAPLTTWQTDSAVLQLADDGSLRCVR